MRSNNKNKYFSKSSLWLILGGTAVVASAWVLLRSRKAGASDTTAQVDKDGNPLYLADTTARMFDTSSSDAPIDISDDSGDAEDDETALIRQELQEERDSESTATTPEPEPSTPKGKYNWIVGGRSKPAPFLESTGVKLINMKKSGGCDLTSTNKFREYERSGPPKFLVIHWGGYDLNNLCNTFRGPREASSNVGTGRDASGNPVIWQFLDLNAIAWHAGGWKNELSIGVDIAQDPTRSVSFYKDKGYSVKMMDNDTGRGETRCLTLDPVVKEATQAAIVSLCRLFGIPIKIPRGARGESDTGSVYYKKLDDDFVKEEFTGVLAHFHVSNNKWDIAPWWEDVMLPILD